MDHIIFSRITVLAHDDMSINSVSRMPNTSELSTSFSVSTNPIVRNSCRKHSLFSVLLSLLDDAAYLVLPSSTVAFTFP